ncbi:MAG: hypothetical protein Q9157_003062 [Trypethelium eluteriae]
MKVRENNEADGVLDGLERKFGDARSEIQAEDKAQILVKVPTISIKKHPINSLEESESTHHKTKKTKGSKATSAGEKLSQPHVSDLDKQSAGIIIQILAGWGALRRVEQLSEATPRPLYLRGFLADAMDVDRDELKAGGKKLMEPFQWRLKKQG